MAGITEVQVFEHVMGDGARLELEVLSEVLEVGGFGGLGFSRLGFKGLVV